MSLRPPQHQQKCTEEKDRGESSTVHTKVERKENIKVCIRIRPPSPTHSHSPKLNNLEVQGNTIVQCNPSNAGMLCNSPGESYTFDKVFDTGASNYDVYMESGTQKIVRCVTCEGHHGAAFAYGKTGSGKTYTMVGNDSEDGVISLALQDFFYFVEKRVDSAALRVKVSYLEVYNEECRDLLSGVTTYSNMESINNESVADAPISRRSKKSNRRYDDVQIFDSNSSAGVVFRGLTEIAVSNANDALLLVKSGELKRKVESTGANERSSRSHSVFRIVLEFHGGDIYGSLSLVDLAGQESLKSTLAEGQRLTEGNYINKSLSTLGLVIWKLSESPAPSGTGKALKHIPYRDSKLTRILRQSLSGHAKLAIICTVSPSSNDTNETCNTLKFAARAKRIKQIPGSSSKAVKNEDKMLLRTYLEKIKGLEEQLKDVKNTLRKEKTEKKQVTDSAPSIVEIQSQPPQAISVCTFNDLEDLDSIAKATLALENIIPLLTNEKFVNENVFRNQKSCSSSVSSMTNEKDRLCSDSVAYVVPELVNALTRLYGVLDKNQESLAGLTEATQSSCPTHSVQEYSLASHTLKRSVATNDHPLKLDTIEDSRSFEETGNLFGCALITKEMSDNETQRYETTENYIVFPACHHTSLFINYFLCL